MPKHSYKNRPITHKPNIRDTIIFGLLAHGLSEEEIAAKMHTDLQEVADGRVRMLAHKATLNHEIVDMISNQIVIEAAKSGKVKAALDNVLGAKRVVVTSAGVAVHPDTGELITEPDVAMQNEGIKTWSSIAKNIRAQGAAVQVNAQFNNSNTQNNVISGGRSFEARRRAAAERRGVVVDGNGGAGTVVADAETQEELDEELPDGETNIELDDADEIDDDTEDEED
ncbi:MAG TPA: hypothetical protein VN861_03135 [Candidatus Acidoferrales bacterium]|nr:hypothetical protein [Candidatus Acidoferrales bacterium]